MSNKKVAVIMSVYKSDNIEFIKISIDSILLQSFANLVLFIQVDGPVSNEVRELLECYSTLDKVEVSFNKVNMGLAERLNNCIERVLSLNCFDYVARMDADDISTHHRIETQVNFLESNKSIDVVGSDVKEINESGSEVFYKKMESSHDLITLNIIKKCPFNHPTVMFRISVFEKKFRYDSKLKNTQDYYFWIDLIAAGMRFSNINEPLLYFRVDNSFHYRRGIKKANNDLRSRLYAFKKLKNASFGNVVHVFLLYILRLSPAYMKKFAYRFFR